MLHTRRSQSGQATIEFAFASMIFLLMVFGAVDFGRAIFMTADLHNAVREGSRYGTLQPTDLAGVQSLVVDKAHGIGLALADVTASCSGACTTGDTVTVSASLGFRAVTQSLLGIPALTLNASSTAEIE